MINIVDIDSKVRVDTDQMGMATAERALSNDGLMDNHCYVPLGECEIDLDEAEDTLRDEALLLERVENFPSARQIEELHALLDELYDEFGPFGLFDLGVTGLIQALTAIGCVTITSCNGGVFGDQHEMAHPCIYFHAPPELASLLIKTAKEERVGLENSHDGMLFLYTGDIWRFNHFGRQLIGAYRKSHP